MSDILNVEELLSVAHVPHPTERDWVVVEREHVLLAALPPHAGDPAVRRHRVKRPIIAQIGDYTVRGKVHLIAGIQLDPFLARSGQHFLPITETLVTSTSRPDVAEQHLALLVNVRRPDQPVRLEVVE